MKPASESTIPAIWWVCLAGFALVALNVARSLPQVSDLLLNADGDDQMRLVQVRDWLAGQGWFDTRQYRVLPPEGISMHWSRYVDAGIAAILVAASWILPATAAEFAAVILWPSLLACLMVLVIAHGTARLFGAASAIGALAVFLSWGKLGGEFVAPRIDHHNVQILCGTVLFYLSLIPGRARMLGAMAGAVTAFSLAVGLEMLPFLALVWGIMALRYAFAQPGSGDWLLGFGAAFALAAPLLMAGQTAPAHWAVNHCDVLAPPVMALGAIGVVATLAPVLAERHLKGPRARILVLAAITAFGIWLAFPLLGPCLAGPYAQVAPEVVAIIEGNVTEALSATRLLQTNPDLLARVLLPPLILVLLATLVAWRLWPRLETAQRMALVQALAVVATGFVFASIQIRAANLMAPAVPLLGGFLVHAFILVPRQSPLRLPAMATLLLALPVVVERGAGAGLAMAAASGGAATGMQAQAVLGMDCRSPAAMSEIASLPRSVVFSTLNLGPAILTYTQQSATSAGYHRNPEAFWNGVGAFESLETLRDGLAASGADYLVLCPGGRVERSGSFSRALIAGDLPSFLTEVTGERRQVRVYRVDKAAVALGAAP